MCMSDTDFSIHLARLPQGKLSGRCATGDQDYLLFLFSASTRTVEMFYSPFCKNMLWTWEGEICQVKWWMQDKCKDQEWTKWPGTWRTLWNWSPQRRHPPNSLFLIVVDPHLSSTFSELSLKNHSVKKWCGT